MSIFNERRQVSMMLVRCQSHPPGSRKATRKLAINAAELASLGHTGSAGNSMTEVALVLPILLLLLMGILLTAIAYLNNLTLTQAVNASASDLQNGASIISPTAAAPYTDPCTLITTKAASYAYAMDTTKITYTIILNNSSTYPAESGTTDIAPQSGTFSCGTAPTLQKNTWATVIATYPCDLPMLNGLIALIGGSGLPACQLQATSTIQII